MIPVSAKCPWSHPFSVDAHQSCCSSGEGAGECLGRSLKPEDQLSCCKDAQHVPCSDPPCSAHLRAFEGEGLGKTLLSVFVISRARKKGKNIKTYFFTFLAKNHLFTFLASKITFFPFWPKIEKFSRLRRKNRPFLGSFFA